MTRHPSGETRRRRTIGRSRAVAVLERALLRRGLPRLQMTLIVVLTGAVGFVASATFLAAGVSAMAVRYPAAVLIAYGGFLLLLRWWASHQRGRIEDHVQSVLDAPYVELPARAAPEPGDGEAFGGDAFGGGAFGGGGAGGTWSDDDAAIPPHAGVLPDPAAAAAASGDVAVSESATSAFAFDADEGWVVLVPIAIVVGALTIAFATVYAAPALFAEVLLDVVLVSGLYRRLKHLEPRSWLQTAVRRTWFPVAAVAVVVALAGFVMQDQVPDARSIGDVLRAARS